MTQQRITRRCTTAFAVLASFSGAHAADLRIGLAAPATSMDPHFFNAAPNATVASHVFDRLTSRTPDAKLIPWLAERWKPVDETTWEFSLRPGVMFHDGSRLTSEDVAFSLARAPNVPNSPGGFGGSLRAVRAVEVIDPATIRIHTHTPAPNMPGDIGAIAILSRHVGETAVTEDYNSGKAAIGTGPYRLVRYVSGDRVDMVRNEAWWGAEQEWDKVSIRFITNPGSRTAALLAGDVDLIDFPPASDLPRLKADPNLSVYSVVGLRLIFLYLDFSRDGAEPFVTGNDGQKLPNNPLKSRLVRQALSLAINRQGIAERVMQGTAVAAGQWVPPGIFGYAPSVTVPLSDPNRARALLAEAGYPEGFKLTIHTPNDRYPNDAATAQAVAQMWSRIGIQTGVEALPWSSYPARAGHQEFSVGLWGWGGAAEAGNALINIMGTYDPKVGRGTNTNGRYSNPALDALTDQALATMDDNSREKLLIQAVETAMTELPIIPLHTLINFWAARKGVVYEARANELTLAIGAHLAK
jgi:peptide/nickel transport system substrate-binding protein